VTVECFQLRLLFCAARCRSSAVAR
jgi:hypothetical protein